ncbi:MAG: efflux RND transporter periplasmic adaptor subunit [Desulfuromusa sp.]
MQHTLTKSKPFQWGLLLAACFSLLFLSACDQKQQAPPQRPMPQVSFITVAPRKVQLSTQLPGRTSPFRIAEIRPQVSGLILERLFTEGSDVKAGQVLYQIDPASFQAALESATANLDVARKNVDRTISALEAGNAGLTKQQATLNLAQINRHRMDELFKARAVSASDHDQAVTNAEVAEAALVAAKAQVDSDKTAIASAIAAVKQAEAALKITEINLAYTKITAPVSGRIGRSNITAGAIVMAYQPLPLATIQQLDPIYVDVPQSTADLLRLKSRLKDGRLQQGTDQNKVKLILEDGTAYPQEGTLQFSDVTVDPSTGSVTLRILFPNPDGMLLPGMFVQTIINEGINNHAILIPQPGVARDPKGNPYALLVDAESKAAFHPLTLDRAVGDKWLVSGGLVPGDKVIVEGLLMLRPGTPVKATPFQSGAPANEAQPPQKPGEGAK